jgi:hypothetical protein
MTYTHKLASRMARLRHVALLCLAGFAACSGSDPLSANSGSEAPTTPTNAPPSSSPSPSPSVGASHEPSGFVRIAENDFTSLPADESAACSGPGVRSGCWARYTRSVGTRQDASAPKSPGSVLEYTWPKGLPIGTSAGSLGAWDGLAGGDLARTEYREVYESDWFKLKGSDFEAPGAGMKLLGFWGVGQGHDWNRVANQIYTMIPGGVHSSFTIDIRQQNQIARSMQQNVDTRPLIRVGQWTRFEIYMKLNDLGAANGVLRVWINGTLTHDYRDVVWRTSSAPSGFFGRNLNPIWGGAGQPRAKGRSDTMQLDHIYVSGSR